MNCNPKHFYNSVRMTPDKKSTRCYHFPEFMLRSSVSQTAKIIYMMLYDRAQGTTRNQLVDKAENVYIHYPLNDLVLDSGKSISAVKIALNELVAEVLLEKERGKGGEPNRLYVLIQPVFEPWSSR